jgi:Leucine-rich repeat (LRR) protein
MAEQARTSRAPLACLFLCLQLLSSSQQATSKYLDDDDHDTFSSGQPRRTLSSGGTTPQSLIGVPSRNSSNSSGAGAAFCRLLSLQILDLSNNRLTGELPDCWWDLQALQFMDLSNNSFSGEIPAAEPSHNCSLESVHLAGNRFTGVFPPVLRGCDSLATLDIGNNRFFGGIPPWIGTQVPSLRILSLRSNRFTGEIPRELSRLSHLQLLDMANNSLTGQIPVAFGNLTSMRNPEIVSSIGSLDGSNYQDRIDIIWKGQELIFQRTIRLLTGIDLSGNLLSDCIPEELTSLHGLRFLNLSRNHLSCGIPRDIGSLNLLESLDLSWNQLSGAIPLSISALSTLSTFNISNNHLAGRIPSGSQIQTLDDPSIYSNNYGLCGLPLIDVPCANTSLASDERNGEGFDQWLCYSVIAGVVFGFWLWFGMLFTIETWRSALLFCVDKMHCKVMQKVSRIDQFLSKRNTDKFL